MALAAWHARLAPEDEHACERLATVLHETGWLAQSPAELAARLTLPALRVIGLLQVLVDRGTAVRLAEDLFIHADAVSKAQEVALRLFARAPTLSTMDFRDALGVSRKYAVPLLDHLDAVRFTVRAGNQRTPNLALVKYLHGRSPFILRQNTTSGNYDVVPVDRITLRPLSSTSEKR